MSADTSAPADLGSAPAGLPAAGLPPGLDVEALAAAIAARLAGPSTETAPLLDLPGVARRLNVSERLVETFVAGGDIPCLRIGQGRGVRRFEPAAVEAFIRRQASGGRTT